MKHTLKSARTLAATLITFGSLTYVVKAAVTFTQVGNDITMTVTNQSYTLTTDQTQDILFVAFLDVFPTGGDAAFDQSRVAGSVTYSVNGGPTIPIAWWSGWQYRPGFQSPWTSEDVAFLLELNPNTLLAGDTITINGSLTMNASLDPDIIMPTISSSTQTVIGGHDFYYSSPSPIPESSTALLLGLGTISLVTRRHRKS